ncbi:MAG TPA: DUF4326 domain-containing protein [Anaerolineae bacterium]|nr:DUF4326 domain-containing protein [Anaerolineae bacterium]
MSKPLAPTHNVIHMRDLDPDKPFLYIGRAHRSKRYGEWSRSPLANPNKADKQEPGKTLPAYRRHLWQSIQQRADVREELLAISEDTQLICWCDNPATCHGSVVRKAARWIQSEQVLEQGKSAQNGTQAAAPKVAAAVRPKAKKSAKKCKRSKTKQAAPTIAADKDNGLGL